MGTDTGKPVIPAGSGNRVSGEIWQLDLLHGDHWEVYKNLRDFERGVRDRAVWSDGRVKERL